LPAQSCFASWDRNQLSLLCKNPLSAFCVGGLVCFRFQNEIDIVVGPVSAMTWTPCAWVTPAAFGSTVTTTLGLPETETVRLRSAEQKYGGLTLSAETIHKWEKSLSPEDFSGPPGSFPWSTFDQLRCEHDKPSPGEVGPDCAEGPRTSTGGSMTPLPNSVCWRN